MSFDHSSIDLPVKEIIPEVISLLTKENTLIVNAPPGAGKSTIIPLTLLNAPWLHGKKIIMLEPRRLAARTIAARMASLLGEEVGETVGYRIRFDNKISKNTRIEVVTEGILTRMLQSDNALEQAGMVIFDEFHERSIFADVSLALCKEAQQILRPDLRIMLMSATLNVPQLQQLLQAPTLQSQGRQHPVELIYCDESDEKLLPELTARVITRATKEQSGDILVFFPGEGEIRRCEEIIKSHLKNFAIHPMYGQLSQSKQLQAILPNKSGKRKIVLATSIAETSLTIEGIKTVIDTGFGRTSKFNPRSGLSGLTTIEISKDSADQRAGRAGRLGPGTCYRMWSKATQNRMRENRVPEIMEADLASLVLDMAHWGIENIEELTWLTPPPPGNLAQAREMLHLLGALENNRITPHGKKVYQLPCHPRLAHMLIKAREEDLTALATDVAAILEERDPLSKEEGIDLNLRIEALRRFRNGQIKNRQLQRIEKVANSYRKLLKTEPENGIVDPYETGLLIVFAHPERIAHARPGNNAQFKMANGSLAMAGHKDDLAHEPWLAIAQVNSRDGMGKIFMASPLNPKDLAPMVKEQEIIEWDYRSGHIKANKELRIGNIVLQSKPLQKPGEKLIIEALCNAIQKEGENLLDFNERVTQWQNRVSSLKTWHPEDNWPDMCTENLVATCHQWLAPYLSGIKKSEELKKLNLVNILHHHLDWEKQKQIEVLAPDKIIVPSGSSIKIQYQPNGTKPILAVRIQEVFGLLETPSIDGGNISLILHLLSPGFRPVQITEDLKSFWKSAYFEVKKDLKARYPKHFWPDDPLTALAINGVKKNKKQ